MRRINYNYCFKILKWLFLPLLTFVFIIISSSKPNSDKPDHKSASFIAPAYANKDIGKDAASWRQTTNLEFIENRGQIIDTDGNPRSDIAYVADGNGVKLYFTSTGVSYVFTKIEKSEQKNVSKFGSGFRRFDRDELEDSQLTTYRMDMKLLDSNPTVRVYTEEEAEGYFNYYYAHCPDGILGVKAYKRLIYENIYDNIDLVFFDNEEGMEYDFVVKPGGKAQDIRFQYEGAEQVSLLENGKLKIVNPLGQIIENEPKAFTGENYEGMKRKIISDITVKSHYRLDKNIICFEVGDYDTNQVLIIDPDLLWATYYGGSFSEGTNGIVSDASGNVVITGSTNSTDFPVTTGAIQSSNAGGRDVFIVKFTNNGSRQWATYYGGSSSEGTNGIVSDASGNVVITGSTNSTDFPVTSSAFRTSNAGSSDAFIVKFTNNGSRQWATYYGGSSDEIASGIAIDGFGGVLITGITNSTDFPLIDEIAWQWGLAGLYDAYIVKFSSDGNRQWATYYGGSSDEGTSGIATDGFGDVLITGGTNSTNFPVTIDAFQTSNAGGIDAFIVKLSSDGMNREWATYYGGSKDDDSYGIATDGTRNVVITGETWSSNLPVTSTAFQTSCAGIIDAFIVKFSSIGRIQWASYYGGNGYDKGRRVATDNQGNVMITGETSSTNFPVTSGAFQTSLAYWDDAFIAKFNSSGNRQWATYYGGNNRDFSEGIVIDGNRNVLITGQTYSTDFPVTNDAFQTSLAGNSDAFIVKFLFDPILAPTLSVPSNGSSDISTNPTFRWNADVGANSYRLQVSLQSDLTVTIFDESGINATSKTATGLAGGTKYYWRVNATGENITTEWSDVWSFTTIRLTPAPPTLLAPADQSTKVSTLPTLVWQASIGAESYRLQVSAEANFSTTVHDENGITATFKKIEKLDNDRKYYWRVLAVNSKGPGDWSAIWQLTTVPILTLNSTISFPQYEKASDYSAIEYKIVGLPGANDLPIETLLSGNPGTDWQVYWDDGLPSNDPKDYLVEFDKTATFKFAIGRAFWIIRKGNLRIITNVEAAPLIDSRYAALPLHRGWNLITNPFLTPINWSTIEAMNGSINPIWKYNGAKNFSDTTLFEPYVGYYFYADSSFDTLKIPYPQGLGKPIMSSGNSETESWRIHISLSSGNFTDKTLSFGISEQAKKGLDKLDFRKPRGIALVPTVCFIRPEWDPNYSTFATDIRPEIDEIETWDFEVRGAHQQKSQLDFKGIEQIPEQMEIYLIDEGRGISVNLREQSSYNFMGIGDIMKFQVVVGKLEAVQEKLTEINIPQKFALGNNYPNPFNPTTTIPVEIPSACNIELKIYNILGQKIKSLFEGKIEAGRYIFTWNGRDETGNQLSSGVYLLHLNSDTGIALSNKMILLR